MPQTRNRSGRARLFPAVLDALIILLIPLVSDTAWYDSIWAYRKAFTMDGNQVSSGPHDNFPLLISLTDTDLAAARATASILSLTTAMKSPSSTTRSNHSTTALKPPLHFSRFPS
jgi:hypothetical protein